MNQWPLWDSGVAAGYVAATAQRQPLPDHLHLIAVTALFVLSRRYVYMYLRLLDED